MKKILVFDCDLTEDYSAIALSTHLKDYKLCWNLNTVLDINLQKNTNFVSSKKKPNLEEYSFFYHEDKEQRSVLCLLANKKNNVLLLDKMPETDFLLLIKGKMSADKIKAMIKTIRSITNILTAFVINMAKYSEMNSLLSDLELHCIQVLPKEEKRKGKEGV